MVKRNTSVKVEEEEPDAVVSSSFNARGRPQRSRKPVQYREESSGDDDDSDEVAPATIPKRVKKEKSEEQGEQAAAAVAPPTRKRIKKDPEAEETASKEIDRLLLLATNEFAKNYDRGTINEIDPNKTLAIAKKKLGSPALLGLLRDKLCKECKRQQRSDSLGMFFFRNYMAKPCEAMDCLCSYCMKVSDRVGDWTRSQASQAMRSEEVGDVLSSRYSPKSQANSGWCRGTNLYSSHSVSFAAFDVHGSVWDLHFELALYFKRTGKNRMCS